MLHISFARINYNNQFNMDNNNTKTYNKKLNDIEHKIQNKNYSIIESKNLYLKFSNNNIKISEKIIINIFNRYRQVKNVTIKTHQSGKLYAFVDFDNLQNALNARR